MTRPRAVRPRHAPDGLEVRPDDAVLTPSELALRLRISSRTLARSGCPALELPQRPGATGERFRRRYILRVALAHFSARVRDPRIL